MKTYKIKSGIRAMIPRMTAETIERYVNKGIQPGGCITALLQNRFYEFYARADAEHNRLGRELATVLADIPMICWGDVARVERWITQGGLEGMS